MTSASELLARYLHQRIEFGDEELIVSPATLERVRRNAAATKAETSDRQPAPGPVGAPVAAVPIEIQVAVQDVPTPLVHIGVNPSLDALRQTAMSCTACGLAGSRTTVVFGEGDPGARLVVVGEAPGADEDRTGRPFVGRAGKLLDTLLASVGYPRSSVYICNVLKCRPPGNRNPLPLEVEACSPFLKRQIELVAPAAILAVGTFPAQTLLGSTESIGQLRGTVHEYQGVPLVPTYHPAALLRNPGWIRPVWEDLQRLRVILDQRTAAGV